MSTSALLQASRGPVMLITLGTLFALDHFRSIEFWRTWPILLIVFGAFKLLEALVRRNEASEVTRGNLQ